MKEQSSLLHSNIPSRNYAQVISNAFVFDDRFYPPSTNTLETNRKNEALDVANG